MHKNYTLHNSSGILSEHLLMPNVNSQSLAVITALIGQNSHNRVNPTVITGAGKGGGDKTLAVTSRYTLLLGSTAKF